MPRTGFETHCFCLTILPFGPVHKSAARSIAQILENSVLPYQTMPSSAADGKSRMKYIFKNPFCLLAFFRPAVALTCPFFQSQLKNLAAKESFLDSKENNSMAEEVHVKCSLASDGGYKNAEKDKNSTG